MKQAKMTNFEVAVRTPLIIRAPWMKASIGRVTSVLAEAVDFYPTLVQLAGLPDPVASAGQHINGEHEHFCVAYP
jgi:arylsulfatase A-like enzyme